MLNMDKYRQVCLPLGHWQSPATSAKERTFLYTTNWVPTSVVADIKVSRHVAEKDS